MEESVIQQRVLQFRQNTGNNKHSLTKRAPDAGESAHIPSSFTRLIIFPVGRRSAARPSAGNANRSAAERQYKDK